MTMQELIERLEKSVGPDRELDIAIFEAVVAVPNVGQMVGVEPRQRDPKYTPLLVPHPKWGFSPAVPADAERYTASIDAALTLVPEGYACALGTMGFKDASHKPYAIIWTPDGDPKFNADGATPAIALCIASLHARLALASDGEKE